MRDDPAEGKVRASVMELAVCAEKAGSLDDAIALMQTRSFDLVIAAFKSNERVGSQLLTHGNFASFGSAIVVLIENGEEPKTLPLSFLLRNPEQVSFIQGLQLGSEVKSTTLLPSLSGTRAENQHPSDRNADVIEVNGLRLDGRTQEVTVRGRSVLLTALEFKLLHFLVLHPNQIFNRGKLLAAVWEQGRVVNPRTVDVHMRRLREKIETLPDKPSYLMTVRGAGYRFVPGHDERAA